MDRCALFVDAGYLLADGAMAVHGTRHREAVSWDYAGLLQLLNKLSRERTGLPLLRCYWYEATVEGRRTPEHDTLADIPGLKLRLARIRPGRREGVDAQVHRDLMTLARNNAVCDAVVVSGDEDLAQVVCDAQDLGIRVTVVHISADGNWAVSRTLRRECDDLIEIGGGHLRPYVHLISGATETPALGNGHQQTGNHQQASHPQQINSPQQTGNSQQTGSSHQAGSSQQSGNSHQAGHQQQTANGQVGASRNNSNGSPPASPAPVAQVSRATHAQPALPAYPSYAQESSATPAPQPVYPSYAQESSTSPAPQAALPAYPSYAQESSTASASSAPQAALPAYPSYAQESSATPAPQPVYPSYAQESSAPASPAQPTQAASSPPSAAPNSPTGPLSAAPQYSMGNTGSMSSYQPSQVGAYTGPQAAPVPIQSTATSGTTTLSDAVKAAHKEGHDFGESVAKDAPALWLEAVLARKPRMPSDLEARLLQGSSLPIDFLLHDEVRHALRRGFWDALERARH